METETAKKVLNLHKMGPWLFAVLETLKELGIKNMLGSDVLVIMVAPHTVLIAGLGVNGG
jgi:hypothetical protein